MVGLLGRGVVTNKKCAVPTVAAKLARAFIACDLLLCQEKSGQLPQPLDALSTLRTYAVCITGCTVAPPH